MGRIRHQQRVPGDRKNHLRCARDRHAQFPARGRDAQLQAPYRVDLASEASATRGAGVGAGPERTRKCTGTRGVRTYNDRRTLVGARRGVRRRAAARRCGGGGGGGGSVTLPGSSTTVTAPARRSRRAARPRRRRSASIPGVARRRRRRGARRSTFPRRPIRFHRAFGPGTASGRELSPSSPNCTTTTAGTSCTVTVNAPVGQDTFIITAYSLPNGRDRCSRPRPRSRYQAASCPAHAAC